MACIYLHSGNNIMLNSTRIIFVSDSNVGSADFGMSDIVMESNSSFYFSGKWYLQAFDTAFFLPETIDVFLRDII